MSLNKRIINPAVGGGIYVSHTIKANYYKMGLANLLVHHDNGFSATGVLIEYD